MEQIQDRLLSLTELNERYIAIISYDAISEYYCNKIIPKLNSLERNLRKLLFNIYIVNFGRNYYQATTGEEFQAKIKRVIQASGNKEKKEEERLKQFFYSLEFNDIQTLLFTPSWTPLMRKLRRSFLMSTKIYQNCPMINYARHFQSSQLKAIGKDFLAAKLV